MTSVEDRERLSYEEGFGGGAFCAHMFSLIRGVTEVGRLALLAIGRSVTRPLLERLEIGMICITDRQSLLGAFLYGASRLAHR